MIAYNSGIQETLKLRHPVKIFHTILVKRTAKVTNNAVKCGKKFTIKITISLTQ